MADPRLITIHSTAELRSLAGPWDELWKNSEAALPTLRAELLALWIEHFMPRARVRMLAVEHDGRWIAALPLVGRSLVPGWELGELTGNYWSPAADLLLDPQADCERAIDLLVGELQRSSLALVHFQAVDYRPERWQNWFAALQRHGMAYSARDRFPISLLRIDGSWSKYVEGLSRNHRRQMRRAEKKASQMGGVELRVVRDARPDEVEPLLRRGFEVEDRGWKGREGTSVLSVPGMFAYFLAQARHMAAWGQLQLTFLEHGGQPIAFEYGWLSKGVYQAVKIGYDEAFSELTPGQLIRWRLFEQLHREEWCRAIDFIGPGTRATGLWANDQYVLGRVIMAPRRLSGRLALHAYKNWWPRLRQLRGAGRRPVEEPATPAEPLEPCLA
jgi:CelD/BcsL family acetyltransferase involved in cellulose biosynthesis